MLYFPGILTGMNAMTGKCFADTNVVLYIIGSDPDKTSIAPAGVFMEFIDD